MFGICCTSSDVKEAKVPQKCKTNKITPELMNERSTVDDPEQNTKRIDSMADVNGKVTEFDGSTGFGRLRKSDGQVMDEKEVLRQSDRETFNYMDVIGSGSFGYVLRVRHKITLKYYAMKLMNYDETVKLLIEEERVSDGSFWWPFKAKLKDGETLPPPKPLKPVIEGEVTGRKMLQKWTSVCEEEMMDKMNHPFIVHLFDNFHSETTLYMVMELVEGKTLATLMQTKECDKMAPLTKRKYLAQLLLGIAYIHSRGCVHRDLKPDNVMVTEMGIIKIMDLGLAFDAEKHSSQRVVGGRGFKAPEMMIGKQYKFSIDWWNYGVIAFVLLVGNHPFKYSDKDAKKETKALVWPPKYKEEHPTEVSLLEKLLERDPTKRLGCTTDGNHSDASQITDHPYFAGVDFKAVKAEGDQLRFTRKKPFVKKETPRFENYEALKMHIQANKDRLNCLLDI